MYKKDVYIYPDILYILIAEYEKQQRETMKHIGESIQYIHVQCLPKVSEHPREPYVKRSFSRRSHESSFRRKATNFRLQLVM